MDKVMNCKLTIFTPTYNRAHLLPVLYESLVKQTNKNFVWLIVDDGSKDDTQLIVNSWIKEKKIKIEYYKKENGGKNTAMDFAHEHCCTEYIGCVDSDDYLTENAVQVLYEYFPKVLNDCVGLVGIHGDVKNKNIVKNWPSKYSKIKFYDLNKICGRNPETFLVFKADIVKKFKFPNIPDERFITESVLYKQFLYDYYLIAINEIIKMGEYFADGYTSQGLNLFFKNPKGYLFSMKQRLFYARKYKEPILNKLYYAASYYAWKKINKIKDNYKNEYKLTLVYKFIGVLLFPIVYIKYLKQYKKFKSQNIARK